MKFFLSTITLAITLVFINFSSNAQCPFPGIMNGFGSGVAPSPGNSVFLETCNFPGEYVTAFNVQMGDSYHVSYSGGSGNSVVVYDTSFAAIASGGTQTTFTAPYSGTYYSATFINPGCGSDFSCNASLWTNVTQGTTMDVTSCIQYTWPFNNQVYTNSGTYFDSINTVGGYVTMYLNLTITPNPFDLSVLDTNGMLTSNQTSGTYQWIDCATDQPISGATSQSYAPSQSGTYGVILTDGTCLDTTACVTFSMLPVDTSTVLSCTQYTWPFNNQTYVSTGLYFDSVPTPMGYDFMYLNLSVLINPSDLVVINSANVLTSQFTSQPSGSYQWIDCSTNLPVPGATNQSFSPLTGGSYAVIVSVENCSDTSSCESLSLTTVDTVLTCSQYTWPVNNQTYNSTGIYVDSVPTAVGYDLNYLDLTVVINPIDLTVVDSANVLYSQFPALPSVSYQWIDCSTNLPVFGETNQSFAPGQGGSYAVIVSVGNCSDTSTCISSFVGLDVLETLNFSIAPNPTRDFAEINFEGKDVQLEIIDSKGKLLYSDQVDDGDQINLKHFDSGLYFFHFQSAEMNAVLRVIRE